MELPDTIRVKLISDEAGTVSIRPVLLQDMPFRELLDVMVAHCGKDAARIVRVFRGGTLVSGASRYRWESLELEAEQVRGLLARYPDAEPQRPFQASCCAMVSIRFRIGGNVELDPESLKLRRLLHRESFWDVLMRTMETGTAEYIEYSYREQADRYRLSLPTGAAKALREAAALLRHAGLAHRLMGSDIDAVEFFTRRP